MIGGFRRIAGRSASGVMLGQADEESVFALFVMLAALLTKLIIHRIDDVESSPSDEPADNDSERCLTDEESVHIGLTQDQSTVDGQTI